MNRGSKKSNTGSSDDVIFVRQITNLGTYYHKGKVIVTSSAADVVNPLDVVGPKVEGDGLVFYYKTATGVTKTLTLIGS